MNAEPGTELPAPNVGERADGGPARLARYVVLPVALLDEDPDVMDRAARMLRRDLQADLEVAGIVPEFGQVTLYLHAVELPDERKRSLRRETWTRERASWADAVELTLEACVVPA